MQHYVWKRLIIPYGYDRRWLYTTFCKALLLGLLSRGDGGDDEMELELEMEMEKEMEMEMELETEMEIEIEMEMEMEMEIWDGDGDGEIVSTAMRCAQSKVCVSLYESVLCEIKDYITNGFVHEWQ